MDHEPGRRLRALAGFSVRRAPWVLLFWVVLVAGLNLAVPQLESVISRDSTPVIPIDAPASRALAEMDDEFGNGRSSSYVVIVAVRPTGLTSVDRAYLRRLAGQLRANPDVTFVQDIRDPRLLKALTSADGEASYFQVGVPVHRRPDLDPPGQATSATRSPRRCRTDSRSRDRATATITDMAVEVEHSIVRITVVTVRPDRRSSCC